MKHLNLSALMLGLTLPSCMVAEPIPVASTFSASEVAFINEQGTNTVKGSAFIRQRGGGVVNCAGNDVDLIPKGEYSAERMEVIYGTTTSSSYRQAWGSPRLAPFADGYLSHLRTTTCDVDGKFEFQNVAAGSYFIVTEVVWEVRSVQGGYLMAPITFTDGNEVTSVVLSP